MLPSFNPELLGATFKGRILCIGFAPLANEGHVVATSSQVAGSGEPRQACADHDDVGLTVRHTVQPPGK